MFKRIAEQVLAYLRCAARCAVAVRCGNGEESELPSPRPDSRHDPAETWRRRAFKPLRRRPSSRAARRRRWHLATRMRVGAVPILTGQSVRGVTEECSRLGLVPSLIGRWRRTGTVSRGGDAGAAGQPVTVRFGRPGGDCAGIGARGRELSVTLKQRPALGNAGAGKKLDQHSDETHGHLRRRRKSASQRAAGRGDPVDRLRQPQGVCRKPFLRAARRETRRRRNLSRTRCSAERWRLLRANVGWAIGAAAEGYRLDRTAPGIGTARLGARGGKFLRASGRCAEARGRHRNQRQDHHGVSGRFDSARGGIYDGADRHDGLSHAEGSRAAPNTTPESLDLQQMFAEIRDAGGTHAVLEASSHALAMDRLWGCHFAVAIFTNLTRDHLDYHKTFEEYFAAKRLLFEGTGAGAPDVAVINADDPYASQLEGLARRTLTYGLKGCRRPDPKKFALSFRRPRIHGADARGKHRSALAARRTHQRLQHSRGHRRGDRPGNSQRQNRSRASRIWSWFPGGFSASTKDSHFWWWWITRTRTTRCAI